MAQAPIQSTGRPISAVLILAAIFTTALLLRAPVAPRTVEHAATAVLPAQALAIWAPISSASIVSSEIADRSHREAPVVRTETIVSATETIRDLAITTLASMRDVALPDIQPRRPSISPDVSDAPSVPELISASATYMEVFAIPVEPEPSFETSSRPVAAVPFVAVGTAFAKTGAVLSTALKKTGQGIIAPF